MSREDALRYILRGYGEEHPSQPREVGSIPIARSRTHDDPIGLTRLSYLNPPRKWTVLDPKWTPVGSIGPQFFLTHITREKERLTLDYTPGCTVHKGAKQNANWHRSEKDRPQR